MNNSVKGSVELRIYKSDLIIDEKGFIIHSEKKPNWFRAFFIYILTGWKLVKHDPKRTEGWLSPNNALYTQVNQKEETNDNRPEVTKSPE